MSVSRNHTGGAADALLSRLTQAQLRPVLFREGVMLVDSGPGSGKTGVVAARVAHLVGRKVPLGQILCLTFNNGARAEMRDRIRHVAGRLPLVEGFHSWSLKILRDYEKQVRGRVTFAVVDERAQRRAVAQAARAACVSEPEAVERLLAEITAAKSRGEAKVSQFVPPREMHPVLAEQVRAVWARYEAWLDEVREPAGEPGEPGYKPGKQRGLDFDDMLNEAAELLRQDAALRGRLHEEWRHILVDEFQDANTVQYALVRMIAENRPSRGRGELCELADWQNRSLVVVADCDQAIYGFRGGVPGLVVHFLDDYPEAEVAPLAENFRSAGHIVRAAASVIVHNEERTPKNLAATKPEGPKVRLTAVVSPEQEARLVAARCAQLWRHSHGRSGIAVLTRHNALQFSLEEALRSEGVPAVRDRGITLARAPQSGVIRNLLRLATDPHDDDAVAELLRPVSRLEVSRAKHDADKCRLSLWEALAHSHDDHVVSMRRTVGHIRDALRDGRPARAFALAFNHTRWVEMLVREGRAEAQDRLRALGRMIGSLAALEAGGKLQTLDDLYDVLEEKTQPVRILTAHSAKGLEWDYVFLCGADEAEKERWPIFKEEDVEEERRLWYVAMTRARKALFISFLDSCPVRFVDEIDRSFAEYEAAPDLG
jgi:DNA helicase-2/ATP-dependent DNA helicase PcrA